VNDRGYPVEQLRRRGGRPVGDGPGEVIPVRLDAAECGGIRPRSSTASAQNLEFTLPNTASLRQISTMTIQHGNSGSASTPKGCFLKPVVLRFGSDNDNDNDPRIHAKGARPQYLDLLAQSERHGFGAFSRLPPDPALTKSP
jgi:hypothetical protein